ncbi:hypothetical protein BDN67DRAFT_992864 [Paxillus ammoniavirescens]|nr:hypothetical protein BDN67DRAFT_992864 [Paxillus ammoniavirescens]
MPDAQTKDACRRRERQFPTTGKGKPTWWACQLRVITKPWVLHRAHVPPNPYGYSSASHLEDTELVNEINEHLQSIGEYLRAQDIIEYLGKEDAKARYGIKKTISLATAKCWMHRMDYMEENMHTWDKETLETPSNLLNPPHRRLVVWFHDESTFYANDRRTAHWVKKDAGATPYVKGEGASLMVAEFVSADHRWLHSPDGQESACVLFKAGKAHEGYFTNKDILTQTQKAMDLVAKHFADEDHMPKNTPKEGTNWGVESLYFSAGHPRAGIFKGMATILEERGYGDIKKVHAECPKFACDPKIDHCCCCRLLYNEPDFVNVKSNLKLTCEAQGFHVFFLPKFHCELNFIEQQYPPSAKEDDLEQNVVEALASVSIEQMRRYARRSQRFMDAYCRGLSGQQAAWASKKYRGHCVLPNSILEDLEKANIIY